MKKRLICLFMTIIFAAGTSFPVYADEPYSGAYAYSLYCVNTGKFLIEHNGNERLPMASTTKIMTAILGIEYLQADKEETVVTVTPDMYAEGSSMYLKAGEKLLLSDVVTGMLMVSGNDAANAVALTVGGSQEGFQDLMNEKAKSIGLKNTRFVTPSGLDAQGHYTTACDLAKLMEYCMENSLFREIDREKSITVDFVEPIGKQQTYYNENRLLREYDYCIAGKTGYTDKAGRTLVSCAEKDGIRLIAVTLNDSKSDWQDHKNFFDYGFDLLSLQPIEPEIDSIDISVVGGEKDKILLSIGTSPLVCVEDYENTEVDRVYKLPRFVYAPVKDGEKIGYVEYYKNGVYIGKSEVTAFENAAYKEITTSFLENVVSFFKRLKF